MLVTLITRGFQALVATVVLGISIYAVHWQEYEHAPATTSFSAFAGALALTVAVAGVTSIWVNAISNRIMAITDGITSLFLLAGGIAFTVGLHTEECRYARPPANPDGLSCSLVNGGRRNNGHDYWGVPGHDDGRYYAYDYGVLGFRYRTAMADAVFLFLTSLACAIATVLASMVHRRGAAGKSSAI